MCKQQLVFVIELKVASRWNKPFPDKTWIIKPSDAAIVGDLNLAEIESLVRSEV